MTTKEYVDKYNLSQGTKFYHSEFVQDLTSDFIILLEMNKAKDNIKGFENATRCIRMKFDAISNKTLGVLPETLWKYFFATVVAKLRNEICPKDMEKRRAQNESRKKDYEQRKKWEHFDDSAFWDFNFFGFIFYDLVSRLKKPTESFAVLGLPDTTGNVEEVKASYKKLVMVHHPDKGGKEVDFIRITDAKNKCIAYLSKSN